MTAADLEAEHRRGHPLALRAIALALREPPLQ